MTTGPGVAKVCMICGEDCSHRPRTRDARGRYFCTSCYDEAARQRLAAREQATRSTLKDLSAGETPPDPQPLPRAESAVPDALPFALNASENLLEEIISQAAPPIVAPPVAQAPCGQCGHPIAADAILCIHCGYNQQTRRKLKVRKGVAPENSTGTLLKDGSGGYRIPDVSTSTRLSAPFDLFFRPARIFRVAADSDLGIVVPAAMWICGIVALLEWIQTRMRIAEALGGHDQLFADSWPMVWGAALGGGIIAAAAIWLIHGWWYRVRVEWSGARGAESATVRPIFALTTLVSCVPALVCFLVLALPSNSPREAFTREPGLMSFVPSVFWLWSLWTSYVAVRTVFDTKAVRTIVWFIIVPLAYYALAFVVMTVVVVAIAAAALGQDAPAHSEDARRASPALRSAEPQQGDEADTAHEIEDSTQPQESPAVLGSIDGRPVAASDLAPDTARHNTHANETLHFNYPGNWTIDAEHPDYDAHADLYIDANIGGGSVHIIVFSWTRNIEAVLDRAVQDAKSSLDNPSTPQPFETWGSFRGKGVELTGDVKKAPMRARLFVAKCSNGMYLEVHEFIEIAQEQRLAPGLELIRSSFQEPRRDDDPRWQ